MGSSMTFTDGGDPNRRDQQPPLAGQGDTHSTECTGERFGHQILNPIWAHQTPLLTTRRADHSGEFLLPIWTFPCARPSCLQELSSVVCCFCQSWCCQTLSPAATYCNEPSPPVAEHITENQGLTGEARRSPTLLIEFEPSASKSDFCSS